MLKLLPSKDGAVMHLLLVKLGWSTWKDGLYLGLIEALAVTVKEGDVTY